MSSCISQRLHFSNSYRLLQMCWMTWLPLLSNICCACTINSSDNQSKRSEAHMQVPLLPMPETRTETITAVENWVLSGITWIMFPSYSFNLWYSCLTWGIHISKNQCCAFLLQCIPNMKCRRSFAAILRAEIFSVQDRLSAPKSLFMTQLRLADASGSEKVNSCCLDSLRIGREFKTLNSSEYTIRCLRNDVVFTRTSKIQYVVNAKSRGGRVDSLITSHTLQHMLRYKIMKKRRGRVDSLITSNTLEPKYLHTTATYCLQSL